MVFSQSLRPVVLLIYLFILPYHFLLSSSATFPIYALRPSTSFISVFAREPSLCPLPSVSVFSFYSSHCCTDMILFSLAESLQKFFLSLLFILSYFSLPLSFFPSLVSLFTCLLSNLRYFSLSPPPMFPLPFPRAFLLLLSLPSFSTLSIHLFLYTFSSPVYNLGFTIPLKFLIFIF